MKNILIYVLILSSFFCLADNINCDSCIRLYCKHIPKKNCIKRSTPTQGINICIDNSHSAVSSHDCLNTDIKPICIRETPKPNNPPNPSTPIWIGIAALLVSLVTSIYSNHISKKNTESSLRVSQLNLLKQIEENKQLELSKRELDNLFKIKLEIKETCAKFLNLATALNGSLDAIINGDIEEGRNQQAQENYEKTKPIRNELKGYYYSLKVTLDGSNEQREIEKTLDRYMNVTCFNPDLKKVESQDYTQPLALLFHQVKAILHANYEVPK